MRTRTIPIRRIRTRDSDLRRLRPLPLDHDGDARPARDARRQSRGAIPLWLTEYGYQTNPPDRAIGVSWIKQARYEDDAALRAYLTPRVDMLIHFMFRDDLSPAGWQSGLFTSTRPREARGAGVSAPARAGLPNRNVDGALGPGAAASRQAPVRLQRFVSGRWAWITGTVRTNERGFFRRTVRAGPGAKFRLWSALDGKFGFALVVR